MKGKLTLLITAVLTIICLASCEPYNNDNNIEEQEYEYSFDVTNAVNANYFTATAEEGVVKVKSNLPFDVTIKAYSSGNWSCDPSTRPSFDIFYDEIELVKIGDEKKSLTRDMIIYLQPLEICKIKGFDYFNYPVCIRQKGEDGTLAMTADEVKTFNSTHSLSALDGDNDQHYVIGTVKSISAVESYSGALGNSGLYINPIRPEQSSIYSENPWDLEACEMTIDVDGQSIKVKAIFERAYGLVTEMSNRISTGDEVEINVTNNGVIDQYEGIFVHPLSVRKL